MRIVLQRVKNASVTVDGRVIGKIGAGFLALVGFCETDKEEYILPMAQKLAGLRVFEDENEKMNLSLNDVGGELLVVSQFTLYADCSHGRRPSFVSAMKPDTAEAFYNRFVDAVGTLVDGRVCTGSFGADMKVELLNDGPVTIILDSMDIVKK